MKKKSYDQSFQYKLKLIVAYKDILRNHFPPVYKWYSNYFRKSQIIAAKKLKGKECIDVAFFLTIPGMWKLDSVYEAMAANPKYNPFIVIFPYSTYKGFDEKEVAETLKRTEVFVKEKGYEYRIPFDSKSGKWLDPKKLYKPDIVFFCTPYKDSLPQYFIYHYRDTLTCHVPYAFCSIKNYHTNYGLIFDNLVGFHFMETPMHREMAIKHSRNHGANAVVSGYPATEVFLQPDYLPKNLWKPQSHIKKKVIWAPHHSIDETLKISTFLDTCDAMLEMAEKFADDIQFVFKPHQLLKFKLQQIWGVEKTDEYYRRWDSMPNTQLVSDGYVDLFITSDAMIHDCGSFTTEYLFTKKPVMYLCRKGSDMEELFNEFGVQSFRCHYQGQTAEDVERFLKGVVIDGNDPMREQRERFFDSYLKPKNGVLPSQKIIEILEQAINQ